MSLPITGHPDQNPSDAGSASANLITLRDNIGIQFPTQRMMGLLPDSEIEQLCQGRPPFDVLGQFPRWIQKRHNAGETKLVTLIEYYYKWLYCEFGSGYILDDRILSIHDVDETTDIFIDSLANTYAPNLKLNENIVSTTREFIKNIRRVFYASKGTKESIYHFFNTLFKNFVYLEITIPNDVVGGADPFRLNFSQLNSSGHTFNEGSEGIGTTEELFEYSIKVFFTDNAPPLSDQEQQDMENLYRKMVHPVGMKLIFSVNYTNLQNID